MIARAIAPLLKQKLSESKIVVLRGPRGSGKKTLLRSIIGAEEDELIVVDCSDKKQKKNADSVSLFGELTKGKKVIIADEAQLLTNLQEIIDHILSDDAVENLILCCSFEPALQEELWEALRYQGLELVLGPLSYPEMAQANGLIEEEKMLEQRLVYGYFPEIAVDTENAETKLQELLNRSIFTQLAASERINKTEPLMKLLRLLAFNIGNAVSYNELAQECGLDNETAERYVKLLEKADLLFLLPSYSNGHRYELKKSNTVYFTDNGIRNALIRSFQPLMFRNDTEQLWKNWVISERRKANLLAGRNPKTWFWKTHTKQEMDYLEETEDALTAYKFQFDKKKKPKIPASFTAAYPQSKATGVNRSTFWNLISKK